jgi:uncharacterized membrane protein
VKGTGYTLLKTLTRRISGDTAETGLAPALWTVDGNTQCLVFVVEEHADDRCTVYVPMSPTPNLGNVQIVAKRQLCPLNVSFGAAANCLMNFGDGIRDLLADTPA